MTDPTLTQPPTVPDALIAKWREDAPRYRDGGALREMVLIQTASAWAWAQREPEIQARADEELEASIGSLVDVVAAVIANGIACDREDDDTASEVIAAVAGWLEQQLGPSFWIRRLRKEAGR